ncbi:MAG: cellulase family glycosylhydrolase [Giesbergeria sp.]
MGEVASKPEAGKNYKFVDGADIRRLHVSGFKDFRLLVSPWYFSDPEYEQAFRACAASVLALPDTELLIDAHGGVDESFGAWWDGSRYVPLSVPSAADECVKAWLWIVAQCPLSVRKRISIGITNEPSFKHFPSREAWFSAAGYLVAEIRKKSSVHICLPGWGYSALSTWAGANHGWFLDMHERFGNISAQVHHYFDKDGSGRSDAIAAEKVTALASFKTPYPVVIGEMGIPYETAPKDQIQQVENALVAFAKNNPDSKVLLWNWGPYDWRKNDRFTLSSPPGIQRASFDAARRLARIHHDAEDDAEADAVARTRIVQLINQLMLEHGGIK